MSAGGRHGKVRTRTGNSIKQKEKDTIVLGEETKQCNSYINIKRVELIRPPVLFVVRGRSSCKASCTRWYGGEGICEGTRPQNNATFMLQLLYYETLNKPPKHA